MTNAQHTPLDAEHYQLIALCNTKTDELTKAQAINAELLEALQWTESWIVKHGLDKAELITGQWAEVPILGTIRAAIAKATNHPAGE